MRPFTKAILAAAAVALTPALSLAQDAAPGPAAPAAENPAAQSADLRVGHPAPALDVGQWVQGEPIKSLEKGKVYVVEFWATWCGPCIDTIPHLTELSKKHPEVTFIGANVFEQDEGKVAAFVKKMGEKMTYRVALDNKKAQADGAMAKTWMAAAGQKGIPCSFIVDKESTVAWIGHPAAMDDPLAQIVAGTFDVKAAAEEEAAAARIEKVVNEKVIAKLRAKKPDEALAGLDEVIRAHPKQKAQLSRMRLGILLQSGKLDETYAAMDELLAAKDASALELNEMAWVVLTAPPFAPKRDADRAGKWAERAVALTEGKAAPVLDTLARAYAMQGKFDKAVETQQKAIDAADGEQKVAMGKSLEAYKRGVLPAAE